MSQTLTIITDQCACTFNFIGAAEGYRYFAHLQQTIAWQQYTATVFAQQYPSPRLSAWYGDARATYRYSGATYRPQPWSPILRALRVRVETATAAAFNSVLLNYYRNGDDCMGSHSDDERGLGPRPLIASLSLGATRRFILHPRLDNPRPCIKINLPHGSLLLMSGHCQRDWKHSLARTKKPVGPRINLTFRRILRAAGDRAASAHTNDHIYDQDPTHVHVHTHAITKTA